MEINKKFFISVLISILIGSIVGYLALYLSFFKFILGAIAIISYIVLMSIGIPRNEPSSLRYNFTTFAISGIPMALGVYFFAVKYI